MYITLTLCYPACAHHRKTLSIRLLAVGFNNLDGCSGLFRPALLQTGCVPAASPFTLQVSSRVGDTGTGSVNPCWYQARAREPVRVADTGTGTRAGYHATDEHGFPCTSISLLSTLYSPVSVIL